ncbi:conserved hypothetical protein [Ricinus communis]|uniref:RNase H type-1 domain-containing protein n=1 Tax=Ricinus communis TaxID=3988 RepID=B9R860_RICCO|nr:conserved hypothetical protein [Ricinus communis]
MEGLEMGLVSSFGVIHGSVMMYALKLGLELWRGWNQFSMLPYLCKWDPATNSSYKSNTDATESAESETVGFGLVIPESRRQLIQCKSKIMASLFFPVEAEALCLKEALSWIYSLQL